jgi:hypothetical protein
MTTQDKKPARRILSSQLDRESILIDARRELDMPSRRLFGKQLLTLGGLSMLTGCSLTDDKSVNAFLTAVSRLNDRAQAFIFDPQQLAPKRRSRGRSRSTRSTTSTRRPWSTPRTTD